MRERVSMQMESGFAGWQPHEFDVFPGHTGGPAGAQRFKCGFFGRKSRGVMNFRTRGFPAVLDLTFCIYSVEKAVAVAFDGLADPVILDDVDADAGDHARLCYR